MAGGLRLGLGYTLLVLGVIVLFVGTVLSGVNVEAEGEGQECDDGPLGMGDCESGSGSFSFEGAGAVVMVPGFILLLAAAPLIVFGHIARSDARKEEQGSEDGQSGA